MAAAQVAGLNCLKLMNETTAGKVQWHFFLFTKKSPRHSGCWICEGTDVLLLHN